MSLQQAAQRMRDEHVGALVVTSIDAGGATVVGVVTDRDLALEVLARGRDGAVVRVGSLVSGRVVAVPASADLSDAAEAMGSEGVRRLVVIGPQQELIGVVSLDDLIEAWAADMACLASSLRKARERERQHVRPNGQQEGLPVLLPEDALIPSWQWAI